MNRIVAVFPALFVASPVLAQSVVSTDDLAVVSLDPVADVVSQVDAAPASVGETAPFTRTVTIPRLTDVVLEIMADLSSNVNQRGETFPIRLLVPVVIDGVEVIPAGTEGLGEVVHAKRSGGMGSAGELLLTARYLEHDGQRIELRSFVFGEEAMSRIDTVNRLVVATGLTFPVLALAGFFIQGDALLVAQGTPAAAKLTSDEVIVIANPAAEPVVAAEPATIRTTVSDIQETTSEGESE